VVAHRRGDAAQALFEFFVVQRVAALAHQRQLLQEALPVRDGVAGVLGEGAAGQVPFDGLGRQKRQDRLALRRAMQRDAPAHGGGRAHRVAAVHVHERHHFALPQDSEMRRLPGQVHEPRHKRLGALQQIQPRCRHDPHLEHAPAQAVPAAIGPALHHAVGLQNRQQAVHRALVQVQPFGDLPAGQILGSFSDFREDRYRAVDHLNVIRPLPLVRARGFRFHNVRLAPAEGKVKPASASLSCCRRPWDSVTLEGVRR